MSWGCGLPRSACCGYPGYSLDIVDIVDIYTSHKPNSDIEVAQLWWCFQTKLLNGWKCSYILVGPAAAARPCLLCHKIFLLCHKLFLPQKVFTEHRGINCQKLENAFWKLFLESCLSSQIPILPFPYLLPLVLTFAHFQLFHYFDLNIGVCGFAR